MKFSQSGASEAKAAENYNRSVFINCPFDETYAPLMRAIVFAVVNCGFFPRCALESADASEIRIHEDL